MGDISSEPRSIVTEGKASASVDRNVGTFADLPCLRVRHADSRIGNGQSSPSRKRCPRVAGADDLVGLRRVVRAGRIDDQGRVGVDRRDLGPTGEIGVSNHHVDREAAGVCHGDGVRRRRDGSRGEGYFAAGTEVHGAGVHEGATRVVVVGETRRQLKGACAERNDGRGAGDLGLNRRRALGSVEIQVAVAAVQGRRTRDRVRGIRSDQIVGGVTAREESSP